ncbi:hypothetical protein HRW14_07215 [Streptomyces lunaelactis]|uniref:hypothetical protein n=1 Tax=Streptomyces lunaelactis TaxID=1535768 RepID=UPI0015853B43|nr:hypothetical protein [Streptomyces lunaelactis]NUK50088.1 hypothetical protein [Streptomyces lunaelactis]
MNAGLEVPGAQIFFDAAHWIAWSSPYLAALVLVAGGVWIWVAWQRAQRVQAALADRVTVEVVPTSTFDPGEGEIGRWAHHLGRVHQSADGVPARGSAARIRYSVERGKMHCYLEGPATAAAVLAMPGFAEVEVRAYRARKDIQPVTFTIPAQGKGEK